mmetsp:Transcript_5042/g.9655  ORF Transcript_5042/g.9655 Transcript_5042/m.9655 type:complete len:93 (+) Transcript_5042:528-806(+)
MGIKLNKCLRISRLDKYGSLDLRMGDVALLSLNVPRGVEGACFCGEKKIHENEGLSLLRLPPSLVDRRGVEGPDWTEDVSDTSDKAGGRKGV